MSEQQDGWMIEYYDGQLPMSSQSHENTLYENMRLDGVVFVHIWRFVNGQKQTIKLSGFDYYFLQLPPDDEWHFGGWSTRNNGSGYRYIWPQQSQAQLEEMNTSEIENEIILEGIFVPRPDSILLNLENEQDPPTVPGE